MLWDSFPLLVLRLYQGESFILALYLAALCFLFFREKDTLCRMLFVWCPVCVLGLFLIPLTSKAYARIFEGETYYRLLWLLPQYATIAWAGVRLFGKHLYN